MKKDLVCKKEEIKCNNVTTQYKNIQFWLYYKGIHKKFNPNWPEAPDDPYRILIIGSSGSGKIDTLF